MTEENQHASQPRRTEENQQSAPPRRGDDHAGAAANAEQHLSEAHNLSVRLQGKEGTRGHAVWALVREERGKVKTLAVYEGTHREATNHFFNYIHPNRPVAPAAPARRSTRESRPGPRTGRPQGRSGGR